MLTPKRERFIQNLINGMSQREAYKHSYNAEKMKDTTIDNKASELFKNGEVRARYDEVLKKLEDDAIMSSKERMKWLSKVVSGEVKNTTYDSEGNSYEAQAYISDKMKAIDILNKMDGQYIQKVEVGSDKPFEVNIKVVK
jgi:phage terminase small subunit